MFTNYVDNILPIIDHLPTQYETEILYWYREPKIGLNFGIAMGAITFSAETEIAFSTNFDFCQMADWKILNFFFFFS